MNRDFLRDKVYLAALLHDIGKFYQRADSKGTFSSRLLSQSVKNSESVYCPSFKGNFSHKHVLWTVQFFEDIKPHVSKITGPADFSLEHLAGKHHKPENFYEKIIQTADRLSSGLDRDSKTISETEDGGWDHFKKIRMCSVFENLHNSTTEYLFRLPVESLQLNDIFSPQKDFAAPPDYTELWNSFIGEIKFIQADSFFVFAETLFDLLHKYTCSIASSTINLPDVSLFDHLKTTAALATCLYDFSKQNNYDSLNEIDKNSKPFLLIGGDVSGIQSYIYDIVSKSAAKNLKGRSFYVQLLVDTIVQLILKKLNLYSANVIYSSGGGFYLLAPNTKKTREILNQIHNHIEAKILEKHSTKLYLALASETISIDDIISKNINNNWRNLTETLNRQKRQVFINSWDKLYDTFFIPSSLGSTLERDAITGEEFLPNDKKIELSRNDADIQYIRPYTHQQIKLGKILKKSNYWISADQKLTFIPSEFEIEICNLGIFNYFIPEDKINDYRNRLRDLKGQVRILQINNLNFLDSQNGVQNIFGFYLYGGNQYPTSSEGDPLTFDQLAGQGELKRLGYLRMDVDNLGVTFANGFADKNRTFSRYSTLSRSFDYFFKGYLNTLWKNKRYKDKTFIIYSGGDDLFLVGRWNLLIEMAEEIHTKFKKWVCLNPNINISGGISIVDEKYPVLKSSELAGLEESKSKNHNLGSEPILKKNSITILGTPLNWDIEYPGVKLMKNKIAGYLSQNKLPNSFVSKLNNHFLNANIKNHRITNLKVVWMLTYDFTRLAESIKQSDNDVKTFIHSIKNYVFINSYPEIKTTKYHAFELINLAARWAELEIRTNKLV